MVEKNSRIPAARQGDEILFINDTPNNTYRITVVGLDAEFTLRASTNKAVKVPVENESASFNINIERIEGSSGQARLSVLAAPGDTVRLTLERRSFGGGELVVVNVNPHRPKRCAAWVGCKRCGKKVSGVF